MLTILISTTLFSLIVFLAGSILEKFLKKKEEYNFYEKFIFGFIFLSTIALILNFFLPLSQFLNTIFYLLIIFISIFIFKVKINKEELKVIILISILSSLLLIFSYSYRPDAGIYHLPYVSILNNEKIIFGLFNIHERFAIISIIQYISAFNNNFIFGENGIAIPLAIICSFITSYFLIEIYVSIIKKKINLFFIYNLFFLTYIAFKMNRYSEFGNDAPAHFLFFFLSSYFLSNFKNKDKFIEILVISIFILLNKITLVFSLLFPIIHFYVNKVKIVNLLNIKFSVPVILISTWLLKNVIVSSCLIYPVNSLCFDNLKWSNLNKVKKFSINVESFSKGHSTQKDENYLVPNEYNKNFNWVRTHYKSHLKHVVIKNVLVFLLLSLIFLSIIFKKSKSKPIIIFKKFDISKIKYLFLISLFGSIFWFIKAPTFRFGYSYIIVLLATLIIFLLYKCSNFLTVRINGIKIVFALLVFALLSKHSIKIVKNYGKDYNNYPLTKIYSMNFNNERIKNFPYENNGIILFYYPSIESDQNCNYSRAICAPKHEADKKLKFKKLGNYKVYFSK